MTENQSGDNITSIADAVLKLKELRESNKNLNEPDIEEKFARLSLAFKTDKCTLGKRLELQQRQRDIAEKNIESELKALRESLNALNQLCTDSEMREVITKTQQHVDIVQQATNRMSSRAETYGAIQQEQRMNCAFETMLNYVEHLKQTNDKEHMELEEYRRLLAENNLLPEEKSNSEGTEELKRGLPPRSHSLSGSSKPELQRRSSSNTFARPLPNENHKSLTRENSKSYMSPVTSNSGVESRSRLLSAVCLLSNNYEAPRPTNGSASSSALTVSPKSRRSSLPVGPMTSANVSLPLNVNLSFPSTPPSNRNQNVAAEHLDSPQEEREMETDRIRDSVTRTESLESDYSRNGEVLDSDSTYDFHTRSSSAEEDKDNKDSSDLKACPINSFDTKEKSSSFISTVQESFDNEMESEISSTFECDTTVQPVKSQMFLQKLQNWSFSKDILRWNESTLIRLRYLLSAMCIAGAMLSFVITFMPNNVVA